MIFKGGIAPPQRRTAAVAAAGSILFVVCAAVARGGLFDSERFGDAHLYAHYAHEMAGGQWPYRDFFDEYPVLAQPLFLLVRVLPGPFETTFRWVMAVCGVAALVLTVVALRASLARAAAAALVFALSPFLLGPVLLNMYDLFPAMLTIGAVLALVAGRARLGFLLLALAVGAKVYPLVVLPVALLHAWRGGGRAAVRRAALWFSIPLVLVHLPFAIVGPGGLRFSYWAQAKRGLEVESLGGGVLLLLDRLGIHDVAVRYVPPGSTNVLGSTAGAVATVSSIVTVVVVLLVARRSGDDLVLAAAAAIAAFVAFGKVLSPQYLAWLLPFAGAGGVDASAILAASLLLTRLEWDRFRSVQGAGDHWMHVLAPWIVARDLVLVALFALLARRASGARAFDGARLPPLRRRRRGAGCAPARTS